MTKKKTPPQASNEATASLSQMLRFGKAPESMEDFTEVIFDIIELINSKGLTPLTVNVILTTLGDIGREMVNTPEKELKVCLGIGNG